MTQVKHLHGIVPPMLTPLSAPDTLDSQGVERLVERILTAGVHGLFLLGTTGEGPSLSYRLRCELIAQATRQVAGRVPVLVGITDTSMPESLRMARAAADAGATALVWAPPYYFASGQPELVESVTRLAKDLPLPLYLYNMPAMTKTVLEPETIRQLQEVENIIGIKDSSGDMEYYKAIIELAKNRPDWPVLMGPEMLLQESLAAGGDGGVAGGANLCPRLFVELYEAFLAGDTARGTLLQARVVALDQVYRVGQHSSSIIKGLKCALSLLGVCDDGVAEPFGRFHSTEREKIDSLLGSLREAGLPF